MEQTRPADTTGPVAAAVERFLWPERAPVGPPDRERALARIERARAGGRYDDDEAAARRRGVGSAGDRAALEAAVTGRAGGPVSPVLESAPRIGLAVWVAVSVVDVVVYLTIGLLGDNWDGPWVVWPIVGVGLVVSGLWSVREKDRRIRTRT